MKRIIFAVLLSILMLTSGCSGNIQSGGSSSENNKSTADASSTEKKTEKDFAVKTENCSLCPFAYMCKRDG